MKTCRLHVPLYSRLNKVPMSLTRLMLWYSRPSAYLEFVQAVFRRRHLWIYDRDYRETKLPWNENAGSKSFKVYFTGYHSAFNTWRTPTSNQNQSMMIWTHSWHMKASSPPRRTSRPIRTTYRKFGYDSTVRRWIIGQKSRYENFSWVVIWN